MKKSVILTACMSVLALGSLATFADGPPSTCSLATLHGTYAYNNIVTTARGPQATNGLESYDGAGHLKYFQQYNYGGVTSGTWTGTGTYSFAPFTQGGITVNCIATVIYDGDTSHPWTYAVAPDGNFFNYTNLFNMGAVAAGHEDRISRALLVQ